MGAQASTAGLEAVAKHDSTGNKMIPWNAVKEIEDAGRSRISQLEAELAETRSNLEDREELLAQTQQLLADLEGRVEKNAECHEQDQSRLSRMEANIAKDREGTEEKLNTLVLAVAASKKKAEAAEKDREDAVRSASEVSAEFVAFREKFEQEQRLRERAEERSRKLEDEILGIREALQPELSNSDAPDATRKDSQMQVAALKIQLQEQENRRQELEKQLATRDEQLRLASSVSSVSSLGPEDALPQSEERMQKAEMQLAKKDAEVRRLQEELAGELKSRRMAMEQVAEMAKRTTRMQQATDGDDLARQQALQSQVIEKDREVCELQQQLADELAKRQSIQYQVIEKERVICDLQQQVMSVQSVSGGSSVSGVSRPIHHNTIAMVSLPTHREEEDREPDDERSPRNSIEVFEDPPNMTPRGRERSRVLNFTGPVDVGLTGSGSFSGQPASRMAPAWHSAGPPVVSPQVVYRGSLPGAAHPDAAFVQSFAAAAGYPPHGTHLENPRATVTPVVAGGVAPQNRVYVTTSANGYYVAENVGPTGRTSPTGRDRQSRRLRMGSKTFA